MSHFVVYVFTDKEKKEDVDTLLAPYNEDMVTAPYIKYTKEQAIAYQREDIENYKNSPIYQKYLADPEEYKRNCQNLDHIKYLESFSERFDWTDEQCYEEIKKWYSEEDIDDQGNIWSKYPPNAKWDWYEIGGRWCNSLITKEGKRTNEDYALKIDWNETPVPFAFIDSYGRWYEKGNMGWWGIVTDEKDGYEEVFKKFISNLSKVIQITVVDCHI